MCVKNTNAFCAYRTDNAQVSCMHFEDSKWIYCTLQKRMSLALYILRTAKFCQHAVLWEWTKSIFGLAFIRRAITLRG